MSSPATADEGLTKEGLTKEEPAVEARGAATVILLRDSASGPEVFMMRRHPRSDFVGGAYVFPGGRVDPEDSDGADLCFGLDDERASQRLQLPAGGLAYFVAAVRECFEEAGVLLAYDSDGEILDLHDPDLAAVAAAGRDKLNQGKLPFLEFVGERGWRLATDRMHYWAHWITPEGQPKRFDTRFFLAVAPARQTAVHDDHELTSSAWVTPREALDKAEKKEWTIIFPTLRNLMTLVDFSSTAEAEDAGRRRGEVEVQQPRILRREGGIQAVLPGDPGYESAATLSVSARAGGEER